MVLLTGTSKYESIFCIPTYDLTPNSAAACHVVTETRGRVSHTVIYTQFQVTCTCPSTQSLHLTLQNAGTLCAKTRCHTSAGIYAQAPPPLGIRTELAPV